MGRGKEFVALPRVAAFVPTAGDFAAASDWGKVTGAARAPHQIVAQSDGGNYFAERQKDRHDKESAGRVLGDLRQHCARSGTEQGVRGACAKSQTGTRVLFGS